MGCGGYPNSMIGPYPQVASSRESGRYVLPEPFRLYVHVSWWSSEGEVEGRKITTALQQHNLRDSWLFGLDCGGPTLELVTATLVRPLRFKTCRTHTGPSRSGA